MYVINNKKAISLIEILLVLAILSVAIVPFVHIVSITTISDNSHTDDEYMASLLAQHVMETIIAKRAKDPSFLPSVCKSKPVVSIQDNSDGVSEYFEFFEEFKGPVTKSKDSQLYWAMNKFRCKVDTYLLDSNTFKVVVYISYPKEGRDMKVYLERLFSQNTILAEDNSDDSEVEH